MEAVDQEDSLKEVVLEDSTRGLVKEDSFGEL